MLKCIRTDSTNPDFRELVRLLDTELHGRYGDLQSDYDQYNRIENLDTVIVAFWDDVPAGCGAMKPFDDHTAEIKRMFVNPEHRGRGNRRPQHYPYHHGSGGG